MKRKLFLFFYLISCNTHSKNYSFDESFFNANENIDLKSLESKLFPEGSYFVDVFINGDFVKKENFFFSPDIENNICISHNELKKLGIEIKQNFDKCFGNKISNEIKFKFDFYSKRLDIFAPTKMIQRKNKEIAPSILWDEGINAFNLKYYFSDDFYYNKKNHTSVQNQYVNLQPKINIGPWRIRSQSLWNRNQYGDSEWKNNYVYAERGLNNIKSRVLFGDGYFPLKNFDTFKFQGVVIKTDESMYPSSDKSFSPVIKGITRAQARVEIYQDSALLYSTTVPAGEFEINDYPMSGSNSELNVKIIDETGYVQYITVPFTSPAVAVREGYTYYEIALGKEVQKKENFTQASYIHGLPYDLTIYGMIEYSKFYESMELGIGKMLGYFGALSTSVRLSDFYDKNSYKHRNRHWDLRYNKNFTDTNTYLQISYSEKNKNGVSSLKEAFSNYENSFTDSDSKKNELSFLLSQSLSDYGSLSFNAGIKKYWNRKDNIKSYDLIYSAPLFNGKAYLNGGYSKHDILSAKGEYLSEDRVHLGINVPFGIVSNRKDFAYNMGTSGSGGTYHNISVSGNSYDNRISWNLSQGYTSKEKNNTTSIYSSYRSKNSKVNFGYSNNMYSHHLHGGVEGSVLVYDKGVVFGQHLGDTIAVVEATGASNTKVKSWGGIETNDDGLALTGFLTPYQQNSITIDSKTLPLDSSIYINTTTVVPTSGAIVPAKFKIKKGKKVIMSLRKSNGDPVPLGAIVSSMTSDNETTAIVGEKGKVYLDASSDTGKLKIVWGTKEKNQICTVSYKIDSSRNISGIYSGIASTCQK